MKLIRILLWVVGAVVSLVLIAIAVLAVRAPQSQPPGSERVQFSDERLRRGEYLANSVAACSACHSEADTRHYALPIEPRNFYGGQCLTGDLPGRLCVGNLTPSSSGIGSWTDGELLRAMREGISKDGRALAPMMPYSAYAHMSDEDARSIVVYLRSLKPVDHALPQTELGFVASILFKSSPQPLAGAVAGPSLSDQIAQGEYLVEMAACAQCHTPMKHGRPDVEMRFAGGQDSILGPMVRTRSTNITPDDDTGIGKMTEDQFVGLFQSYRELPLDAPVVKGHQTPMHWREFSHMREDDLKAMYQYLRTIKPIRHAVVAFTDAEQ